MTREFVTYEQALALKELGFDERCFTRYYESGKLADSLSYLHHNYFGQVNAPLYQQAFRWFREKYNLNGILNHYPNTKLWDFSVHNLKWSGKELMEYARKEDRSIKFSTYEKAESACLDKLIEICRNDTTSN